MTSCLLYQDLSQHYDLMCRDINYREQCEFSHRALQLFAPQLFPQTMPRSLDLGCGTGPHIVHLIQQGYQATGLDINAPMLEQAQNRCPSALFSLQDMSCFQFEQRFDLITCFLYSIHYNFPLERFSETLQCAYNALEPGGIFIFDLVGRRYIANDSGHSHSLTLDEGAFTFQSRWYDTHIDDRLDLFITIKKDDAGLQKIWQDRHTMLAIEIEHVHDALTAIGFEVSIFDRDFGRFIEWQGKIGNVIFIAQKTLPQT
ncbi:MAG TPA: class I SAM-dependent methyltransferase [Marinagarivorans sp.]